MSSSQQFIHIAGWSTCKFYKKASAILGSLSILFPTKFKVIDHTFASRKEYREWLIKTVEDEDGFRTKFVDSPKANKHTSSPFTWFTNSEDKEDIKEFLGGCDDTLDWCRKLISPDNKASDDKDYPTMKNDGYSADHGYDYDLVVIGGGSGGLAASKEASARGAKVAVLDYVTPSPQGTTWGLGGTCVNVGCIPKKLMHYGALVKESIELDGSPYGIDTSAHPKSKWGVLRENVQNHIMGLNFKYRVNLRENKVTYLNKLGKFVDKNTLELTDRKGKKSTVTATRFLIAVGGRPTTLSCPGSELAISSDDIFSLEKDPGKVLCIGASYISLECAGFLHGLGHDATVAVRSVLLRGFDRECADMVGAYMADHGIAFKYQVTPVKLESIEEDDKKRIQVTFSDDTQGVYDTVMACVGRTGCTSNLGLENVGIKTLEKNAKIEATLEQTSTPNIYVIGDVMEGCPELTPVAIKAGQMLARRLFAPCGTPLSKEPMDYKNVCTTVFTPIEYSCVGLSEEDAKDTFGKENIDVYHKSFIPLEWTLSEARSKNQAFCKVIVDKSDNDKVLGIHYVGPNAGEVMQGYGVAMKTNNLTFQTIIDTVGLHPTTSEEIVTLSVTKSSGADASAGGC